MAKKPENVEMTKEQLEYIKNYGDKIQDIESFVEGVRKLPGFYIGDKGNIGWKACFREIFQNAIDEAMRPLSPCNYVKVTYDERTQTAIIEDNGSGIPHGKIIHIYTTERSSSNYEKKPGEYSSGAHGVGSGVALALSDHFEVSSYVLGKAKHVEFNKGQPWKEGEKDIPCPKFRQGTTVVMRPDMEILGFINLTCEEIYDLILKIIPTVKIGTTVDFIGYDINGKMTYEKSLTNTDGPITGLYMITKAPIITPICFQMDTGTMMAQIMFTYDSGDMDAFGDVLSYANFTPTTSGTHVDGFLDGLCKWFRTYINKFVIPAKSKVSIINNDIKTGLKAVVSAAHLYPVFKGQFKGALSNEDIKPFIEKLTYDSIDDWSKKNPNDLKKVCKFIKDIAEIRCKTDGEKVKLSNQYDKDAINGDPKKYISPSGRKDLELFIVEGDSALGSARGARDTKTQGIFPIRGKLPNAFNTTKAKFLQNPEVAAIIKLVTGGSYGRNIDMAKVKWNKIIFLTDADPDGSHIKTLLLRLFLMYMPQVIEEGRVYAAVPPLFGIQVGKHMKYFTDLQDLAKYSQSLFSKKYQLTDINNKPISQRDIAHIFYNNMDYTKELEIAANTLAVNPWLLESVLFDVARAIDFNIEKHIAMAMPQIDFIFGANKAKVNKALKEAKTPAASKAKATKKSEDEQDKNVRILIDGAVNKAVAYTLDKLDFKKFKSRIEKKYRFIKTYMKDGTIAVEGLFDNKTQILFLNQHTIEIAIDVIRRIASNSILEFKMNGEPTTLYGVMLALDSILPNDIKRYKGLGEQDPPELRESTMSVEGRALIRYTLESAKEEIESIRYIDSNRSGLLNGISVSRQDIE